MAESNRGTTSPVSSQPHRSLFWWFVFLALMAWNIWSFLPGPTALALAGWTRVTEAVHAQGAKMFMQLMHCGRIAHPLNLPAGARVLGPSAVAAGGEMFTDAEGMKPNAMPQADIQITREEDVQDAKNAVAAGFDGIELHGANGYLLPYALRASARWRRGYRCVHQAAVRIQRDGPPTARLHTRRICDLAYQRYEATETPDHDARNR